MANEAHPNPYHHDPRFDPTPGEWETDTGAEPALIYAPPQEGGDESILIATVADDGSEQSATNARVLQASAAMLRMLRGFQRDMDKMGFGADESIAGADAVELLSTIYEEIDGLFTHYKIQPSQRAITDSDSHEEGDAEEDLGGITGAELAGGES
jgi:hypothetical protein